MHEVVRDISTKCFWTIESWRYNN